MSERTHFFVNQKRIIGVFCTSRGRVSSGTSCYFRLIFAVSVYYGKACITNLLFVPNVAAAALGDMAALKLFVFLVIPGEFLIQVSRLDPPEA